MTLRDQIRIRLEQPRGPAVQINGDASPRAATGDRPLIPAAVLIPIVDHAEGMSVLLTQRTEHLNSHAGQISFPGGHREPADRTSVDTALRETEEEVGIAPGQIDIIGRLRDYDTVTGFRITPIVGIVTPGYTLRLDDFEVAEVFEIPLRHALDPENYRHRTARHKGVDHRYCVLDHDERYIWGATAAILLDLSTCLAGIHA